MCLDFSDVSEAKRSCWLYSWASLYLTNERVSAELPSTVLVDIPDMMKRQKWQNRLEHTRGIPMDILMGPTCLNICGHLCLSWSSALASCLLAILGKRILPAKGHELASRELLPLPDWLSLHLTHSATGHEHSHRKLPPSPACLILHFSAACWASCGQWAALRAIPGTSISCEGHCLFPCPAPPQNTKTNIIVAIWKHCLLRWTPHSLASGRQPHIHRWPRALGHQLRGRSVTS